MYCKNCGEEVNENAAICVKCGFSVGVGTKYCAYCGKELAEGQAICMNCGFYVNKGDEPKKEEKNPKDEIKIICDEYRDAVKKDYLFAILRYVCSVVIVLALLFLPIYRCERDLDDLTMEEFLEIGSINDLEDLEHIVSEDGKIVQNFSLYSELQAIVDAFSRSGDSGDSLELAVVFEEALFPLFTLISMIILTINGIKLTYYHIKALNDLDQTTLLTVNGLKKRGDTTKKKNFFIQQSIYAVAMYMIFDIVFAKIFGLIFISEGFGGFRKMYYFSGVSGWIVAIVALFAVYIVIGMQKKKGEEAMLVSITKKEYEKAE